MKLKESIKRKLSIAIVVVMMVSFMFAKTVSAKSFLQSAGGKLMKPVLNFVVFIGDSIISALDSNLYLREWGYAKTPITSIYITGEGNTVYSGSEHYDGEDVIEVNKEILTLDMNIFTDDSIDTPKGKLYSPYEIFSNKVPLFDVNFFSDKKYTYKKSVITGIIPSEEGNGGGKIVTEDELVEVESASGVLQKTVSTWYIALRNIALVILLSVLLYIGIRIVISSNAGQKAQYKQMLLDWVIAVCLVFFMHYIMSFAVNITENISNIIFQMGDKVIKVPITVYSGLTGRQTKNIDILTNFTGYLRVIAGIANSKEQTLITVEYVIMYLITIAYTVMFTITYLKRVVYMAFLTIIAPITAATYPLKKEGTTAGQSFSLWLREYMANLLIQPIQLMIYTLIISNAMNLVVDYPIYAIVCLGFFIPAEKMVFKLFGIQAPRYANSEGIMNSQLNMARGGARLTANFAGNIMHGVTNGLGKIRTMTIGKSVNGKNSVPKLTEKNNKEIFQKNKVEGNDSVSEDSNEKQIINLENDNIEKEVVGNKLRKLVSEKNISNVGKGIGSFYGSLTSAGLGAISGIMSGSLEKTIENTASGVISGAKKGGRIGSNIGASVYNTGAIVKNVANSLSKTEEKKEIKTDYDSNKVMESVYPEYAKNGISKMNEFKAAYGLEKEGIDRKEAIATCKIAKKIGDIRQDNETKLKWHEELSKTLSETDEIQKIMKEQSELIEKKYSEQEKGLEKQHENDRKNSKEFNDLSKKLEDLKQELKDNKDNELKQVKDIPIRYADKIIAQVEEYYENLE